MKLSELAATKWSGRDVKIATAVALAESRGKMDATNQNSNGTTDDGPWQVNSVHGFDRTRLRTDPTYTVDAAHRVWEQQGWHAWVTYNTGAYLPFLGQDAEITSSSVEGFVGGTAGGGGGGVHVGPLTIGPDGIGIGASTDDIPGYGTVTGAANAVTGGLDVIGDVLGALTEPSTWLRIGKGWLGSVIIIAGVGGLVFVVANKAASSPVVKSTASAASKVPIPV